MPPFVVEFASTLHEEEEQRWSACLGDKCQTERTWPKSSLVEPRSGFIFTSEKVCFIAYKVAVVKLVWLFSGVIIFLQISKLASTNMTSYTLYWTLIETFL